MRSAGALFLPFLLPLTQSLYPLGQSPAPLAHPSQSSAAIRRSGRRVHETLESIVIPPKAGVPFTLTLQTEWV
jgi:hypothetical protein